MKIYQSSTRGVNELNSLYKACQVSSAACPNTDELNKRVEKRLSQKEFFGIFSFVAQEHSVAELFFTS